MAIVLAVVSMGIMVVDVLTLLTLGVFIFKCSSENGDVTIVKGNQRFWATIVSRKRYES